MSGKPISPMAAARAGGEPAHVVGDLDQADGDGLERAAHVHDGVLCGLRLEMVVAPHGTAAGWLRENLAMTRRRELGVAY